MPLVDILQADRFFAILRNTDLVNFEERYCVDDMLTVSIVIRLCKHNYIFTGDDSAIVPSPDKNAFNQFAGITYQA